MRIMELLVKLYFNLFHEKLKKLDPLTHQQHFVFRIFRQPANVSATAVKFNYTR